MYLIAGLGNPTREYEKTRHNVGFSVIDVLADKYNIDVSDRKHKALCGRGVIKIYKDICSISAWGRILYTFKREFS